MDTLQDINCKKNIFYNANKKLFEDTIPSNLEFEIIIEPIIVMDTLHSCFSHAILDSCFPIFWIIDELIKYEKITDKNIRIFIRKELIFEYPHNLSFIDENNQTYKGVYKDIINLITPFPLLFEHSLTKNYVFKNCFFYPENDRWQRTPWNCKEYYPGRNVSINNIIFSDDIIYEKLRLFRNMVLVKNIKENTDDNTNNLIIIDRKYNRKIENSKLQCMVQEAEKNSGWKFTGVSLLEDKSFQEQVELFSKHRIFIFRHGSCMINLLWIPNNSIIFELYGGPDGLMNNCYSRICKLTNSKHILLNYDGYDCKKDIFDKLNL